ncbi:efflux RND transporter periplasmic adaptor subunit [Sessilibacter corallicola]|uniref:efflux RND transporter periplasmic adaptor subunit n=1 Tax=Sessilibacter corallicola TaxID=2904075 RepID=UPI001E5D58FF|nr:efflux RND transporter periplasmic adaptor subunit [Sessilibacter corallicola]MCE2028899.1 efflux RND transporter periplasmic adaptor subunit [Sessilibacter corallicola]
MMRMPRALLPVGVIVITIAVVFVLNANKPEPETSVEEPRARSVFVDRVKTGEGVLNIVTQGEVQSRTEINLVAEVSGKIVSVSPEFTEGGVFSAGETLLKIEDSDYQIAVINAQAEVARQRTIVDQGIADAEVARQQLAGKNASALGLKQPQLAEARAGLLAAQALLQQAELNLARTEVSLPFSGRIRSESVGLGQYVTAGSTLAEAFSTELAEIRVPLTDTQLQSLGLPIGFQSSEEYAPQARVFAQVAGEVRQWQGRLIRVESAFDSDTRVLFATVHVDQPYSEETIALSGMPLAVGLYVTVEIEGQTVDEGLAIPRDALRTGSKVYVVDDGKLDIRQVTIQHSSEDEVIVTAGLSLGEQVVVSAVRDPIQGMRVSPLESGSALQSAGQAEAVQ